MRAVLEISDFPDFHVRKQRCFNLHDETKILRGVIKTWILSITAQSSPHTDPLFQVRFIKLARKIRFYTNKMNYRSCLDLFHIFKTSKPEQIHWLKKTERSIRRQEISQLSNHTRIILYGNFWSADFRLLHHSENWRFLFPEGRFNFPFHTVQHVYDITRKNEAALMAKHGPVSLAK